MFVVPVSQMNDVTRRSFIFYSMMYDFHALLSLLSLSPLPIFCLLPCAVVVVSSRQTENQKDRRRRLKRGDPTGQDTPHLLNAQLGSDI
jgi:hypothetical protein